MEQKMKLGKMLVAAASTAWIIAMSHTAASASVGTLSQYAFAVSLLPADHPTGPGAIMTLVNAQRATNLHDPALSTFLVDYPPGASAVLHRLPSSGYVLVYVLSGTIRASAWHAGLGTHRAGETWVEPAFAYSISAKNPSAHKSARTLVVLLTGSQDQDNANGTPLAE
jgi:quercetin dioxygenase-like cupin family protein